MRELKFRVWSECWEKYAFDAELYGDGSLYAIFEDDDGVTHHENTDLVFEFNTGLKDKNGKEIYEGDIIRNTMPIATNKSSTYQVFYKVDFATFEVAPMDDKIDILSGCFNFASMSHYEVIGNIHENPELLEEK